MLFHFLFSLCLGIVLNMMAAAQRIATEVASTRAAAVATSTGNDAPAQQVFCLLASRFLLLTHELSSATLCSGQVRRFPRDEAITFLTSNFSRLAIAHSENCISHRVAAMCREANWQTCAELCNDQPLDACGYIAADAVCRLRSAALAELNGWHGIGLPDYSHLECIHRGNQILNMRSDDRILNSDQVNRLVRHYSQLDQSQRAAEEWWGGAIAIDHFLTGLPDSIQEISTSMSDKQHRWRAWVVNTQSSTQHGSHWFTVVMGAKMELLQSTHEHRLSASSSQPLATISQLLQSTAEDPSISISPHFAIHATAAPNQSPELPDDTSAATAATANASTEHVPTEANPNNYPNLFISPEPALSNALRWAHANAM